MSNDFQRRQRDFQRRQQEQRLRKEQQDFHKRVLAEGKKNTQRFRKFRQQREGDEYRNALAYSSLPDQASAPRQGVARLDRPISGRQLSYLVLAILAASLLIIGVVAAGSVAYRNARGISFTGATSGGNRSGHYHVKVTPNVVRIPPLRGDNPIMAMLDLNNLGLSGNVIFQASPTVPISEVINTRPGTGKRVPKGSNVTIITSCGQGINGYCA